MYALASLHSKQANPSLFLMNSLLVPLLVTVRYLWRFFLHLICCVSWVFSFLCVFFLLFLCDKHNLLIAFPLVLFKRWLTCWPRGHFANSRSLFVEPRIFPHLVKYNWLIDWLIDEEDRHSWESCPMFHCLISQITLLWFCFFHTSGVASLKIAGGGNWGGAECMILGEQHYFVWKNASQSTKWLYFPKIWGDMAPLAPPGYAYVHHNSYW